MNHLAFLLTSGLWLGGSVLAFGTEEPFDVLIRGGTIVDGTGRPGFTADVGVRGERIVFVGAASTEVIATTVIDAGGQVVAPGFIDVHSHTDEAIARAEHRLNEGVVRQGVTLVVGGPDGMKSPEQIRRLLAAYGRNGIGTNIAFYVGHGPIRAEVMGHARRPATAGEIENMQALVREGMELGCVGLSTGLMYPPGAWSDTDELVALARAVAPHGGIYDSHVRDPVARFVESDAEAIEIGRRAGIPVKIAHEKTVGLRNAGKNRIIIHMIEEARRTGREVVTDQYPYDGALTTTLDRLIIVPPDLKHDDFNLKAALRDPALRPRLQEPSEQGIAGGFAWLKATGYDAIRITVSKENPALVGCYLSSLAEERGLAPFDLLAELIIGAEAPLGATLGAVREEDVRELLVQPWNMIATDGGYADGDFSAMRHPRSTGTFPRVLGRYVRELKLLSLEEAVRKMTSLPADFLAIPDRGRVATGLVADLVVFDPAMIRDCSTWEQPELLAVGVTHVLVNGRFVLRAGRMTGEAPGRFVAKRAPTRAVAMTEPRYRERSSAQLTAP